MLPHSMGKWARICSRVGCMRQVETWGVEGDISRLSGWQLLPFKRESSPLERRRKRTTMYYFCVVMMVHKENSENQEQQQKKLLRRSRRTFNSSTLPLLSKLSSIFYSTLQFPLFHFVTSLCV